MDGMTYQIFLPHLCVWKNGRFYSLVLQHNIIKFSLAACMCWDVPMKSIDYWDGNAEHQKSTEHVLCWCEPLSWWVDLYSNKLSESCHVTILYPDSYCMILRFYGSKFSVMILSSFFNIRLYSNAEHQKSTEQVVFSCDPPFNWVYIWVYCLKKYFYTILITDWELPLTTEIGCLWKNRVNSYGVYPKYAAKDQKMCCTACLCVFWIAVIY